MELDELFDRARPLTAEIVAEFCRQEELPPERQAELLDRMFEALRGDDHAHLRRFTGERVALGSYLATLLPRLLEEAEAARGEELLLDHLDMVQAQCRRFALRKMHEDEADDFYSMVVERLCEDGYRVLRRFRGSSLRGYVARVTRSVFIDRVVRRKKGRFRPSEVAKGLGLEAEMLEELVYARGFSGREAVERVLQEEWTSRSREELEELLARLPVRENPLEVPLEEHQESRLRSDSEEVRLEAEMEELRRELVAGLRETMGTLSPEERVLLRMIFRDGLSVADCHRILRVEQRPLYRQRDGALRRLKAGLEERGLDWERVRELLKWEGLDLGLDDDGEEDTEDDGETGDDDEQDGSGGTKGGKENGRDTGGGWR